MPRHKIVLPTSFSYETSIPVRIDDINYGNHLSNDRLMSLAFEARVRFYKQFGLTELSDIGTGTIMSYANINYKKEAHYGDTLTVQMAARSLTKVSFEIVYHFLNQEKQTVATMETGIVSFDYKQQKISSLPEPFKKLF